MEKKRLAIKNHLQETHLFKSRCLAALLIVFVFALILIVRLGFLQLKDHHFYSTLSRHNLLNIIPIEANRGLIYDRNGVLLAKNIPTFTLAIIPSSVPGLKKTLDSLNEIIPITPEEIKQFQRIRYQYHRYQAVPIKYKLTEEAVARFYVNRYQFPGVLIKTRMMRYYPLGSLTADVVGYVGRINPHEWTHVDNANYLVDSDIGKIGIEQYYEKQLHGTMGAEEVEINASGRVVRVLKRIPPKPGNDIYLAIDSRLQKTAQESMGEESGAIVAMEPGTGQILALVTNPSYDPNLFVNGITQEDYQKLVNSPLHPLYNRAIRGQFAAGSTIKPIFALAGLDDNVISPESKIYDPGWFQLPHTTHIYHDWVEHGHGWVNLKKALIVSCDVYFYNLAAKIGLDSFVAILQQFGFGQPTGIDMPGEVSGLVPTPEWKMENQGHAWYTGDTIETGIGQGFFLVTPLQLAQAVSTLAEHGMRYRPDVLLKLVSAKGNTILQLPIPESPAILKNPENWNVVIDDMADMVDSPYGTAEYFGSHRRFTVAAKTGTAQVYGHQRDEERIRSNLPKRLRNNHLFIAFAPVQDPHIAIAVVVEHAAMADKMAGEVLNDYFKLQQEQPQK